MSEACEQVTATSVQEPIPAVPVAIIEDLANFEAKNLKHTDMQEKNVLPSKEDIESEKKHISLVTGLETFDKNKLKPTTTQEKIVLPDKESKDSFI